jgi:hypothetical protein
MIFLMAGFEFRLRNGIGNAAWNATSEANHEEPTEYCPADLNTGFEQNDHQKPSNRSPHKARWNGTPGRFANEAGG